MNLEVIYKTVIIAETKNLFLGKLNIITSRVKIYAKFKNQGSKFTELPLLCYKMGKDKGE